MEVCTGLSPLSSHARLR